MCMTIPGTYPWALMEALKKLKLVQLISVGKVRSPLPCFHRLTYVDIEQTSPRIIPSSMSTHRAPTCFISSRSNPATSVPNSPQTEL